MKSTALQQYIDAARAKVLALTDRRKELARERLDLSDPAYESATIAEVNAIARLTRAEAMQRAGWAAGNNA